MLVTAAVAIGLAAPAAAGARPRHHARVRLAKPVIERVSKGNYNVHPGRRRYFEFEPRPRSNHVGPLRLPSRVGAQSVIASAAQAAARGPSAMSAGIPDPIRLLTNTDLHATLADPGYKTGSGWETTTAEGGGVIFYTGNWFAAYSLDAGRTFTYVDPYSAFPAADGGFAADQVVRYIPKLNEFVWLLQYGNTGPGTENRDRLAIASPKQIAASKGSTKGWRYVDVTSRSLGQNGNWLDFPDLTVGTDALYLTTNVFHENRPSAAGGAGRGTLIARYPLSAFASPVLHPLRPRVRARRVTARMFYDANGFTLRPAQFQPGRPVAGRRVVFAQHHRDDKNREQLRVYYWDEHSTDIVYRDIDIATIPGAKGKTGVWLDGVDTRILGATKTGDEAWFAWTAGRAYAEKDMTDRWPWPHIEIARIGIPSLTLRGQRFLYNRDYAFAFPALATNRAGEVGISFEWGSQLANFGVGILTGNQHLVNSVNGDRLGGGHYQSIAASGSSPNLFAAAGRVELQDPSISGFGNHAYYVLFGRASAVPVPAPAPLTPSTLTISNCPSSSGGFIQPGNTFTFTGALSPAQAGAPISVTYHNVGSGTDMTHSTSTAPNGSWQDVYDTNAGTTFGPNTAQAHYAGDATHQAADSPVCSFDVHSP